MPTVTAGVVMPKEFTVLRSFPSNRERPLSLSGYSRSRKLIVSRISGSTRRSLANNLDRAPGDGAENACHARRPRRILNRVIG